MRTNDHAAARQLGRRDCEAHSRRAARSDIDFVLGDLGATLRSLAEGIPDRLAGEIAAHQGNVGAIHKALEDAMRELLLAVSAQMQQRMEALTP